MPTDRVSATPAARRALDDLCSARGGTVMFVQSGGCCDGTTPICFGDGEFIVGGTDVLLGSIDGCPFYIDVSLDKAWKHDSFILDVAPGAPEGFSLAAGDDLHFVAHAASHVLNEGCTP